MALPGGPGIVLLGLLMCTFTCATGNSNDTDLPFGSCLIGRESCSECYLTLKKSLLSRDDNILNLSLAFYPPQHNIPEFVSITYLFGEAPNASNQTWFWTHDSSYLFFPIQTYQYHSLFFGKLEREISQTLILTLDAECKATPNKTMELLTQRLKDFIEWKKYNPRIDQNYFAKALHSTDDLLDSKDTTINIAALIITFYVLGSFFVLVIIVMMIVMYLYSKRWDRKLEKLESLNNSTKRSRSKIYAVAVIGLLWNLYIFTLDITALIVLNTEDNLVIKERKLNALSSIVFVFTILSLFGSLLFWGMNFCFKRLRFIFLALSTLGPTYAIIIHIPYITIAFLNDAYHASSVFIFYIITSFVVFGALDFTIGTCQVGLLHAKKELSVTMDEITNISPNLRISIRKPNQPQNGQHQVVNNATFITPGNEIVIKEAKVNELENLLLSSLQFPQSPVLGDNVQHNGPLILTVRFDAENQNPEVPPGPNNNNCKIDCTLMPTKTKLHLTVPRSIDLNVPANGIANNENITTITFQQDPHSSIGIHGGRLRSHSIHCCPSLTMTRWGTICIYIALIPLFLALLLALIVLVACVLIFVPINDAFADAPNRLVGFYQSVLILIGAYFVYKKFFKKEPSIEEVVKKRKQNIPTKNKRTDEEWQQLSKDERVEAFYSRIVSLIANYHDAKDHDHA